MPNIALLRLPTKIKDDAKCIYKESNIHASGNKIVLVFWDDKKIEANHLSTHKRLPSYTIYNVPQYIRVWPTSKPCHMSQNEHNDTSCQQSENFHALLSNSLREITVNRVSCNKNRPANIFSWKWKNTRCWPSNLCQWFIFNLPLMSLFTFRCLRSLCKFRIDITEERSAVGRGGYTVGRRFGWTIVRHGTGICCRLCRIYSLLGLPRSPAWRSQG